jgi:Mrp family chromosome partitioning ATPase/capsular polysaccharide biosynthesis protein
MTLNDLTAAVRRFKWLALSIFLVLTAIGLAAAFVPTARYESSVTVLVQPAGQGVDFGTAEATQVLVPPVAQRVGSSSFADAVSGRLPGVLKGSDVQFTAETPPGTGLLTIKSSTTNRAAAKPAADAAVAELQQHPVSPQIQVTSVNPATGAESLAAKRNVPIILGSMTLGAILGVLAALLLHMTRRRLASGSLVREKFGLKVLAEIPDRTPVPRTPDLFGLGWPPEVLEAYQRMAANLEILLPDPAAIAVVSWDAEEGKTTVASNLAWALATMDRRVLAVDCDLRHPGLDLALGIAPGPGVAELANSSPAAQVRQSTRLPALAAIAAGEPESHPAAPVAKAIPILLGEGRRQTETVLIDTPPMLAAEATSIISRVDAVIVVVDMKRRSPEEFEAMMEDLTMIEAKILGVVLNRSERISGRRAAHYYYSDQVSEPGRGNASSAARPGPVRAADDPAVRRRG